MLILKKSGEYEEFDYKKVEQSAINALNFSSSPTRAAKLLSSVKKSADKAISKIVMARHDEVFLSTYDIRCALEQELMKLDYRVARAYIVYPYEKEMLYGNQDAPLHS